MKYLVIYLLTVFCYFSFAQSPIHTIDKKYYYGLNNFYYKDSIKGKIGESQINLFIFKDSTVTNVYYHRFIYDKENLSNRIIYPNGQFYVHKTSYVVNNNDIKFSHNLYQYFIQKNEDTLFAYVNDDLLKYNKYDVLKEISVDEVNNILNFKQ